MIFAIAMNYLESIESVNWIKVKAYINAQIHVLCYIPSELFILRTMPLAEYD